MTSGSIDSIFDWVTARHAEPATVILERLRRLAERDAACRSQQVDLFVSPQEAPYGVDPSAEDGSFAVTVRGPRYTNQVSRLTHIVFELVPEGGAIRVRGGRGPSRLDGNVEMDDLFTVDLGTADPETGSRTLLVDGEPAKDWEIMYRALEPLFFGADE